MQGKAANDIQHGISKDLFYYVLLMKRQPAWFDERVARQDDQVHDPVLMS